MTSEQQREPGGLPGRPGEAVQPESGPGSGPGGQGAQTWSEADSATFLDLGRYAVPEREAQIETICALLPLAEGGRVVELCCGAGLLTRALLERFPKARVLALDGSGRMLAETRAAAGALAQQLDCRAFDLAAEDWRSVDALSGAPAGSTAGTAAVEPIRAVVSSLAIHHLDGAGKRKLYRDVAALLAPSGAFVIADLIAPAGEAAWHVAAAAWDLETKRRALEIDGDLAAFERFRAEGWNFYSDPNPDPVDQPSGLLDQLLWLREAGLVEVDVYWMKAGHAIFGGRKRA